MDKDGIRKDKRKSESLAPSSSKMGLTMDAQGETAGAARFKHHDVGFRGLEFDDELKMGKRSFNVNSVTRRLAKHETANEQGRSSVGAMNKNRYDLVTGKPQYSYLASPSQMSNGRKTMLPPSKDFASNGHG